MNTSPFIRILRTSLAAVAFILSVGVLAADDSFTGTWKITEARTLKGQAYEGSVRIAKIGAVYELAWDTSAGKYRGLGLADGDKLCTGWGGKQFGVVLYKINGDGTLTGRWTTVGANEAEGKEQATGGKPDELEGEYTVKGTNPGGAGGYEGQLRIRKTGETYELRWTIPGSPPYSGVGLKVGDSLHVGWGIGSGTYAVISYAFKGDTVEGIWTTGGATTIAKEDLARK